MCSGIELDGEMHLWSDPEVRLPIALKDGGVCWLRWGERYGAKDSFFYEGPCARLESIKTGKWDKFSPRAVKVKIDRYMERDHKGRPYWVKTDVGQYLQGMVANWGNDQRVYVVTVDSPAEFQHVQPRWPRLVG